MRGLIFALRLLLSRQPVIHLRDTRILDIQTLRTRHPSHWQKAAAIRTLTLDAVRAANSGHSGMPMGMADVATVLFENHLKFDASAPDWQDRDRFILSAGHGSMLLYSLLHLTGYADMTIDQLRNFRQWGAITAGHPEYGHATGIEVTTGPLGQGLRVQRLGEHDDGLQGVRAHGGQPLPAHHRRQGFHGRPAVLPAEEYGRDRGWKEVHREKYSDQVCR